VDYLDSFQWHSSIGIDDSIDTNKKFVSRVAFTDNMRRLFADGGDGLLIHKSTKALWRVSDDGNSIEPVFDTDVLTEEELLGED